MKFYWNALHPEVIYVMGFDEIMNKSRLYVLLKSENVEPANGRHADNNQWNWVITCWGSSSKTLKASGFELLGEL